MGVAFTTAGITLGYAVETTAGTRPTTGYILIPDIKGTPDFDPTPAAVDTTPLSATEYKTYAAGLKDLGGVKDFKALRTEELEKVWEKCVSAYEALAEDKAMWFEIKHPKLTKSVFFKGQPTPLGAWSAAEIDQAVECNLHIAPLSEPINGIKSTDE